MNKNSKSIKNSLLASAHLIAIERGISEEQYRAEVEARFAVTGKSNAPCVQWQRVPSWDDPVYWKGVRIGQCVSCKRQHKDVLRNGLCWLCDTQNPQNQ